uniref:Uncharacterized protein n=1 Tax=uncultured Campylobacterota bacterium TaxID=120858 RepID=Q2YZI8_9BACT|nr:hypothetical protein [uncultured Campylobacterota bacterium]
MDFNGLSIDQAPPISAPVRFFLTAPLFGILAGFMIFFSDSATLMSRYSIDSIVITHAMTIGFLGFVMLGSMTQMLPVLAGAKIPNVKAVTKYSHALLVLGAIFMFLGLLKGNYIFNIFSFIGLGSGFIIMLAAILISLKSVENFTATVRAMLTSVVFAFFVVLMGLYLLYSYILGEMSALHIVVANVHSVWGIFGFAGILIIGVSFQVLPMFYVAPKFKSFCKQKVVWLISGGLVLWLTLSFFYEDYAFVAKLWIALFFWAFATTVWLKLNKRRRPISDVTVWYWRSSSIFLTLGAFVWIFDEYFKHEYIVMAAILIGGFILSIMVGMLYKICVQFPVVWVSIFKWPKGFIYEVISPTYFYRGLD